MIETGDLAYKSRFEQYFRAALMSVSVIREALGAGVLYEVVAYVHGVGSRKRACRRRRRPVFEEFIMEAMVA